MTAIAARWEWRTFGPGAEVAERGWRGLTPTGRTESDEVYLLSSAGGSVKVRDDLMDVKQLLEVDQFGLQQWRPVMKASFPIGVSDVERVFAALHVALPPLARDTWTLQEFLDELTGPQLGIRPVSVHKDRIRYRVEGCSAEVTAVLADGKPRATVAVEGEDAGAVTAVVRSLGLAGYVNTSYPVGLARILDGTPDRFAVIDCGTNSIKFHVAERVEGGGWRTVADRADLTRLGEGLREDGDILSEAVDRTIAAIEGMVTEATACDVLAIASVGTAGLRMARNRDEVLATIERRTGIAVEVIPGEEESRLAFIGAQSAVSAARGTVALLDTGGGSTQLTYGHDDAVDERFSVNVGAVRYTERFGLADAVSTDVLDEALAAIATDLARLDGHPPIHALVGMGGAITNITAVKLGLATYEPDLVQGAVLDRAEIDRQIELYRTTGSAIRHAIVGLQPKRADVILAGACIVRTVMEKLGQGSLVVSDRGLRHGLLLERFGH
jgi:exopolyphosphatase / guanosine-5'-triphosphate,3'-diphosphate pyrophosphatase